MFVADDVSFCMPQEDLVTRTRNADSNSEDPENVPCGVARLSFSLSSTFVTPPLPRTTTNKTSTSALLLAFGTTPSQHTPCIHTTYIALTQIPSKMFSLA